MRFEYPTYISSTKEGNFQSSEHETWFRRYLKVVLLRKKSSSLPQNVAIVETFLTESKLPLMLGRTDEACPDIKTFFIIDYGDMQLICEAHDIMERVLGMPSKECAQAFEEWNKIELDSYLIKITANVLKYPDNGKRDGNGKDKENVLDIIFLVESNCARHTFRHDAVVNVTSNLC